jgi:hypothetical protein
MLVFVLVPLVVVVVLSCLFSLQQCGIPAVIGQKHP